MVRVESTADVYEGRLLGDVVRDLHQRLTVLDAQWHDMDARVDALLTLLSSLNDRLQPARRLMPTGNTR